MGFACFGQIGFTHGTYDLYWLVVHPERQGTGIGRRLMLAVEADIIAQGGHQLLIETSCRPDYEKAREFYLRVGYAELVRFKDFYRLGEDKVQYVKAFPRPD